MSFHLYHFHQFLWSFFYQGSLVVSWKKEILLIHINSKYQVKKNHTYTQVVSSAGTWILRGFFPFLVAKPDIAKNNYKNTKTSIKTGTNLSYCLSLSLNEILLRILHLKFIVFFLLPED